MAAKFILPTLALAGSVLAQCSGSITITTSSDAETLASCSKYDGSITIDPSATGTIALDGIQSISGDLKCLNATGLNAITSDQLTTIGGTFDLESLTVLSTLQFSSLTAVNHINWIGLPALQSLNFAKGVSQANTVYISNTQLTDLSGIELSQVGSMDVNNNLYLNMINVNSLTNVTSALSFSANGPNLDISFPNLQGAANLTFRNVSSVEMPSLSSVPGAMGFYSDYFLNFSAPNLTTIGSALAFVDCPNLNMLSFPSLTTISGGFILANNSDYEIFDGFPSLSVVGGAIDFRGTFSSFQFGNLSQVRGGVTVVTSSSNSSVCTLFNNAKAKGAFRGLESCSTGAANNGNGNSTSSGSSSSSSKNAAPSLSFDPAAPLTGIFGLVAAMLFL